MTKMSRIAVRCPLLFFVLPLTEIELERFSTCRWNTRIKSNIFQLVCKLEAKF